MLPNRVLSSPLNCSSIGAACSLYLPPPGAAAARPLCGACAPGSWPPDSGFRSRIQRTQRVKSSWEQREESVTRLAYRELPGPCSPRSGFGSRYGLRCSAARGVGVASVERRQTTSLQRFAPNRPRKIQTSSCPSHISVFGPESPAPSRPARSPTHAHTRTRRPTRARAGSIFHARAPAHAYARVYNTIYTR